MGAEGQSDGGDNFPKFTGRRRGDPEVTPEGLEWLKQMPPNLLESGAVSVGGVEISEGVAEVRIRVVDEMDGEGAEGSEAGDQGEDPEEPSDRMREITDTIVGAYMKIFEDGGEYAGPEGMARFLKDGVCTISDEDLRELARSIGYPSNIGDTFGPRGEFVSRAEIGALNGIPIAIADKIESYLNAGFEITYDLHEPKKKAEGLARLVWFLRVQDKPRPVGRINKNNFNRRAYLESFGPGAANNDVWYFGSYLFEYVKAIQTSDTPFPDDVDIVEVKLVKK